MSQPTPAIPPRAAVIELTEVTKKYGEKTIIDALSLAVNEGEFLTILGESGSGKSTILKMVNGLIAPTSGTVVVNGIKIASPPASEEKLVALRRTIGYAVQGSVLFPHLSVADNIGYVPKLLGMSNTKIRETVERTLVICGLQEDLLDRFPAQLSGGQAQRVGIARSIAGSPRILLMDEPFGAVDEITRRSLQEEISRIAQEQKLTCLFVTHDTEEALKLGTKVLIIKDGRIEQYDTPARIVEKSATKYVSNLLNK